jgi:RNA polymerase III transcription factor (TF)IIIC subunit HTH domain
MHAVDCLVCCCLMLDTLSEELYCRLSEPPASHSLCTYSIIACPVYHDNHNHYNTYTVLNKRSIDCREPFRDNAYLSKQILPLHTFNYRSGPFMKAMARYGYDASEHPEARFLQVVQLRHSLKYYRAMKKRLDPLFSVISPFPPIKMSLKCL